MTTTQRKINAETKSLTLSEIAKLVGGELVGDRDLVITGVAGIKEAQKGDITFLANVKYLPFLLQTQASAVVATAEFSGIKKPLIRTKDPSGAFTKIVAYFIPQDAPTASGGVHASAIVAKSAKIGQRVTIAAGAVIEEEACVGAGSVIGANSYIGYGSVVGQKCRLYPSVTIRERTRLGDRVIIHSGTVIGSDGFGYETIDGKHLKIPQVGSVLIEDDVEIGANVCVDRGRFQDTRIGRGTKIDNLVQIAHNVVIGPDCLIVSQVGISGSTELGKNVTVAGQAGIVGHVQIGAEAVIGARSGVSKSVPAGEIVLGEPARPIGEQKRLFALIARLPEMFKELAAIKKNPK